MVAIAFVLVCSLFDGAGLQQLIARLRQSFGGKISAHADGGPRSRVCARETLRSAPHRHTLAQPLTFCGLFIARK